MLPLEKQWRNVAKGTVEGLIISRKDNSYGGYDLKQKEIKKQGMGVGERRHFFGTWGDHWYWGECFHNGEYVHTTLLDFRKNEN